MSKYVGTMFKYFVELCKNRGIKYIMLRSVSMDPSMYVFDMESGKYEITNEGVLLNDVWSCTFNSGKRATHAVTTYMIQMSDDSHLNFLEQAIYLYDEIVDRNEFLRKDKDHSYIYIPHKTDFVITQWSDLKDPLIYFQPCYHLFDGVDIRFNKLKNSLLLFHLMIGKYGCGMIFENTEDYLKWRMPVEKYIMEHSLNNFPVILWQDEFSFLTSK